MTVALALLAMAAVAILNVVLVAEAGMVTDPGMTMAGLFVTRMIVAPPDPAGWERVTVQVAEAFAPRVEGVQASVGLARPITTAESVTAEYTENPL